jgi:aminopeptidase N
LKATYRLTLDVPSDWVAISNTAEARRTEAADGSTAYVEFAPTEPLSTYLFSFVAGRFTRESRTHAGRTISAYHRETDAAKLSQLDTIFSQVFNALEWQEKNTGIAYPFAKYDFVILPGFQFGGMEHTGATLYNDRTMFLGPHPTPDEELSRANLIAHETSHMWFGDLVTMRWFDDVWTKEVFANYYAAVITEPLFPNVNHTLNRINAFLIPSLNQDRTEGRTAIQQPLDNLQNAGLVYNNIIYDKAPLVMFKIVELMGEDAFKLGVRNYLQRYAYGNATWDDLIECLNEQTDVDLQEFSDVWIKSKGMPTISVTPCGNGFDVTQTNEDGRGLLWRQKFTVKAIGKNCEATIAVDMDAAEQHYTLDFEPLALIPNSDGKGYGYFIADKASLRFMLENWTAFTTDDVERAATVMTIYENYLHHRCPDAAKSFIAGLSREQNPLIASILISYVDFICSHTQGDERRQMELAMNELAETMPLQSAQLQMQRKLCRIMTDPRVIEQYHRMWSERTNALWSESDYTTAAYELALRYPESADSILDAQRSRISNPDRLRQFNYVSRACTADTVQLDELFRSLSNPAERTVEPYAAELLYYLNHPLRDAFAVRYIEPGLEMLSEIQRTGDIFFPAKWTQMLLSTHRCAEARNAVTRFMDAHPDYPPLLANKIRQAAFALMF